MRSPLLLAGGPAAGKTTVGATLARRRELCAFLDVDDLRHLVVAGHRAPWEGAAGRQQQDLGVRHACELAASFVAAGMEVVIADVVDVRTVLTYRERLPTAVIIRLRVSPPEARRRAKGRAVALTEAAFDALHQAEQNAPAAVDAEVDVDGLGPAEALAAVDQIWSAGSAAGSPVG